MTASLYSYWTGLPSAPMQTWADVDLMEIYQIAPLIFVADVERSGSSLSFVYRFVGTKIAQAFGLDATRKSVEEAFEGERAELITKAYTSIVETKLPQLGIRQQANKKRGHVRMAVLTLPLFNPAGEVQMLLGINDFSIMSNSELRSFKGSI